MTKSIFLDPTLIAPHFSTRIYKGYLLYLKNKLGFAEAKRVVGEVGLPWEYLENEQNWVSEKYAELFYTKLNEIPSLDQNSSFLAAKAALSKEALGPIISITIQFQNPKSVYSEIIKFTKQYNKVDSINVLKMDNSHLNFEYSIRRKTQFENEIVDNWLGFLTHIPMIFGGSPAKVEWQKLPSGAIEFNVQWATIGNFSIDFNSIVLGLAIFSLPILISQSEGWQVFFDKPTYGIGFSFLLFGFVFSVVSRFRKTQNLESHFNELISEADKRYVELFEGKKKLDRRYQEANLLRQVINTITTAKTEDALIETTLDQVKNRLLYDRVIYFSHLGDSKQIKITHQSGFNPSVGMRLLNYAIDLNETTQSVFHLGNVFKNSKSILVPVAADYRESLSKEAKALIDAANTQSFLAVPVKSEKESFGILLVDYNTPEKKLTHDDLHIIENVAIQLGIALQNARSYETEKNLRLTFQKFVPEPVLKKILGGEGETLKQGFRKNVVVLFSDLRDFTRNATSTTPENLVEILNSYFNQMTRIVYESGGIVDKFLGDGLFAIFDAFEDTPNAADRALDCAIKMHEAIASLNSEFQSQNRGYFPLLKAGIGIHSGEVTLCTLGNDEKTEFTAIGETVNLAARLEGKSKELGEQPIVFSQSIYQALTRFKGIALSLGKQTIRGLSGEHEVFGINQKSNILKFAHNPDTKIQPNKGSQESRFQSRTKISSSEPFRIIATVGGKILEGRVRDISSFGCRIDVGQEKLFLNSNQNSMLGSEVQDVQVFMHEMPVGHFEKGKIVRAESGEIALEFETQGNPKIQREFLRIPTISGFECEASFSHPLKFDSAVALKGVDFSSKGASFITSARNNFFFRNLLVPEIEIQLKGIGTLKSGFRIKSVKAFGDNKIRLGGLFENKLTSNFDENLGTYLCAYGAITENPKIHKINLAGLRPLSIKSVTEFQTLLPGDNIDSALQIRESAYGSVGRFDTKQNKRMTDAYDKHSLVVLAKLGRESVGSVRITYSESENQTFELEESILIPPKVNKLKTIEVSRLSVMPAYQKTDLVVGLVQRAIEIGIKRNVSHVITSCTEEKIPIYKNLGFEVDPKAFELKTLSGIPHFFLHLPVHAVVPTGKSIPIYWHFTYGPVVQFLKKFGHYSGIREGFLTRIASLFLPILLAIKKRKKRILKKPYSDNFKKSDDSRSGNNAA